MKLTDEMVKALQERLPDEAVTQHPTKTYLSSIKAIYCIERLNKVFGIGQWRLKPHIVDDKTDMIVVQAVLTIPEYDIELESFGGNDNGGEGSRNFDRGDAYKGAVTDAFTKICSFLEIGIDVFKGKQTGASNKKWQPGSKPAEQIKPEKPKEEPPKEKTKPTLSNKQIEGVAERIKNGENDLLDKVKKAYTLTEGQLSILEGVGKYVEIKKEIANQNNTQSNDKKI